MVELYSLLSLLIFPEYSKSLKQRMLPGRKIAVFGRSMVTSLETGQELGYIVAEEGTFIHPNELKKYKESMKISRYCVPALKGNRWQP